MAQLHLSFLAQEFFSFQHPTTILIAGPTMSGKTHFLYRALKENLFSPTPSRIIWVYGEWQNVLDQVKILFPQTEFTKELGGPLFDSIKADDVNLVIIDDLMEEVGKSEELAKLFTKGAHHRNLTVVFLVQNLFHQGKAMRTVSLNSQYLVLFKNPRDRGQIAALANQMYPGMARFLVDAYADATKERYGYLILDLHPDTSENLRVRTGVFPGDKQLVYLPARAYKKAKRHSVE